jgi:acyl-CoA synthetase (AMP-forming)/AMP-acid ligase II
MTDVSTNIARRLTRMAQTRPEGIAVVEPAIRRGLPGQRYRHVTFRQLDEDSDRIAAGLMQMGVVRGTRLALLVRPGIDFVSLVFAMYKAAAVAILIDPGMGRRSLVRCLAEAEPEGFVAIPPVHAVCILLKHRFPKARFQVTVGRRWFWGGVTLEELRRGTWPAREAARVTIDEPAAIIFTTGSTGPPKGVLFTHGNFDAQVEQIRDFYDIQPGEIDLPCFPLFGLFNCAMGVTAVIPEMDPSRPARVNPAKIIRAARDWNITQAFGSPAVWDRVGRYCHTHSETLPTVRRVLSAGAPVPVEVLRRMKACIHGKGDIHTPYGATEALPVASISASQVLQETAALTEQGAGVCVGRTFAQVQWKVIRIVDGPIPAIERAEELPADEIGELIVCGPQVTRQYVTRTEANRLAKIADGSGFWHRMGDSGYLDASGRFWFCGRVAHAVRTPTGWLFPVRCEAIFNRHPDIRRSALVGIGPAGRQRPVIVLEPHAGRMPRGKKARANLLDEIRVLGAANPLTAGIADFLFHHAFPVDIRHNAKIFREKLAVWASTRVAR